MLSRNALHIANHCAFCASCSRLARSYLAKGADMSTRQFALALGIIFIGVGVLGFIPGINHMHDMNHDTNLTVTGPGTGMLLGLFHVNLLHNLVHILFGVLGVAAAYGGWSRGYCQFVAIAYGLLAILGLIPTANVN